MRVSVLSAWIEVFENGVLVSRHPHAMDVLKAAGPGWGPMRDVTGQPVENLNPAPNLVAWEGECLEVHADALEADPDCYVLWVED